MDRLYADAYVIARLQLRGAHIFLSISNVPQNLLRPRIEPMAARSELGAGGWLRRVGARIDRRLCFALPVCVSADPVGDRHAETCHPVEHVASDFRLGPLIGQSPCVKSSADDGLVAKHRRLNQTPAIKPELHCQFTRLCSAMVARCLSRCVAVVSSETAVIRGGTMTAAFG